MSEDTVVLVKIHSFTKRDRLLFPSEVTSEVLESSGDNINADPTFSFFFHKLMFLSN